MNLWRVINDSTQQDRATLLSRLNQTDYVATVGDSLADVEKALQTGLGGAMVRVSILYAEFLGSVFVEGRK